MEHMEYRGNQFWLEQAGGWYNRQAKPYQIRAIKPMGERVWLPDFYHGSPISRWEIETYNGWEQKNKDQHFQDVKSLYIPAEMESIHINNDLFPNLEQIQVDPGNRAFYTDGRMLFSADKQELLYCLVCKGERISIPDETREITAKAFYGTEYQEILFPKKDLRIHSLAFQNSTWLKTQGEMAEIGTMLYWFDSDVKCLIVPDKVRKFHPDLFRQKSVPEKMVLPFFPTKHDIDMMNQYGRCRSLTVRASRPCIRSSLLRKWDTLEEVIITGQEKVYKTIDGVMYSGDQRTLIWYPSEKADTKFNVPDGVQRIAEYAFAGQKYLCELSLPDCVRVIGVGAFLNCERLEKLYLSPNIRELPDSNAYQRGGVCEGCTRLKSIALPEKLEYLGSFSFYDSGLESIEMNHRLEQIGEFALMAENLETVFLPPSVKRLGKGSLYYVTSAEAYEGTAKGLVAAINTAPPDLKDNISNVGWERCAVTVLHRRSEKKGFFLIPGSLKKSAAFHLDMAWNGDRIDYTEYDQCLYEITDSDEKLEFAEQGFLRNQGEDDHIYMDYIRQVSYRMGYRLLEQGKEKEFLVFLKRDILTENALSKLLKYSNTKGMTVCSAYLIEILNKKRKKTKGFRI